MVLNSLAVAVNVAGVAPCPVVALTVAEPGLPLAHVHF